MYGTVTRYDKNRGFGYMRLSMIFYIKRMIGTLINGRERYLV